MPNVSNTSILWPCSTTRKHYPVTVMSLVVLHLLVLCEAANVPANRASVVACVTTVSLDTITSHLKDVPVSLDCSGFFGFLLMLLSF